MIRYIVRMFFLLHIAHADAATGSKFWENCPGPACPARQPESVYFKSEKPIKNYEIMDRVEIFKEREIHEKAIRDIDKVERRRDIKR